MVAHRYRSLLIAIWLFAGLQACAPARSPVPPGIIPEAHTPSIEDEKYGHQVVQQLQERYKLDYNNPRMDKLQEVVDRLTKAAGADKDPWHVFLFKDDSLKNAAATRGNHVFVWTGLLNDVQSDDEMALILSHEIAHVLARHTAADPNDELKKILIQIGAAAAGIAVGAVTRNPYTSDIMNNATSSLTQSVGEAVFMHPYSKEMELEADRIGLLLLAKARYNPESAVAFWERAQRDPAYSSSLPFFSDHPDPEARLQTVRQTLPLAMQIYRQQEQSQQPSLVATGDAIKVRAKHAKKPQPEKQPEQAPVLAQNEAARPASPPGVSPDLPPQKDAATSFVPVDTRTIGRDPADAFDLNRQSGFVFADADAASSAPPGAELPPAPAPASDKAGKIKTSSAKVFAQPRAHSKQLATLSAGTSITVVRQLPPWVEISKPMPGYLRAQDAQLESEAPAAHPSASGENSPAK